MSNRVIHFEIHAADPEKTQKFYNAVFNWQFMNWAGPSEYWMITTGDAAAAGINGGMMKRPDPSVVGSEKINGFVCTVDVSDIDDILGRVTAQGGIVVMPKRAVPGIGWFSYCKDIDGNLFGVMQQDANVKAA